MDPQKREELALQVDEAEWSWLRPHLERDGIILVAADMDLAEVGTCLAADDSATLSDWIGRSKVGKPSDRQILEWDLLKDKKFNMLVISPYVLIQEQGFGLH